jgi:hypothetical protein
MPSPKKTRARPAAALDLSFRPPCYFTVVPIDAIRAERSAAMARRVGVLDSSGSFHPLALSGAFLPEPEREEVEIAHIALRSTTGDRMSVRARRVGARIAYSVHDEYDGETLNEDFRPRSSRQPLTLRQLVALIDAAYDVEGVLDDNLEGGADVSQMRRFVSVSSPFYPQLGAVYEQRVAEHLDEYEKANLDEDDQDEDEDEERESLRETL